MFLVAARTPWSQLMVPQRERWDQGFLMAFFLKIFSVINLSNQSEIENPFKSSTMTYIIKQNCNLLNRNYLMKIFKTYNSTRRKPWNLGWAKPQELQAPNKSSDLMPNETTFHYSKITMSQESCTAETTKMSWETSSTMVQNTTVQKVTYKGWKPSYLCTMRVSDNPP